jgi:hypothetical protein
MLKKTKIFIFLMLWTSGVCAVTFMVTNDLDDAIASKKIWVRFSLGQQECGIIKNTLQFSADSPDITLASWHPLAESTSVFVDAFKKNKNMLVGPFAGWLAHEIATANPASIYVSGLVVGLNGKVKPFSCAALLNNKNMPSKAVLGSEAFTAVEPSVAVTRPVLPDLEKSFVAIEHSERQWNTLGASFAAVPWWRLFAWFNLLMWLVLFIRVVHYYLRWRRIPAPRWVRRDYKMIEAFVVAAMLDVAALGCWLLTGYGLWIFNAVLCGIAFMYVIIISGCEETLWGRFKNISGITCGILVMPFILKAVLLYYGMR